MLRVDRVLTLRVDRVPTPACECRFGPEPFGYR
jgi:hypothetical protein